MRIFALGVSIGIALATLTSAPCQASEAKLADAAERNDISSIGALLDGGAKTDARQADGMTALHWAVYHDNLDAVLALIGAGAEPSVVNRYQIAPLTLAARNGNEAIVRQLIEAGADANTATPGGETALMSAARTGRLGAVKALLEAGAKVDATLKNGQTALMWATAENHLTVVRELIDSGARLERKLGSGYDAFFFAVREGHREMTRLLLAKGANLHASMQPDRLGDKLPQPGTTALALAIMNGHLELAIDLLELGADPNDAHVGQTPLHLLVRVRKPDRGEGAAGEPPPPITGNITTLDFARELVKRGANVNSRIEDGEEHEDGKLTTLGATPLLLASDTADLAYMKLLVELGADPFLPNAAGTTPLMAAAGLGSSAPEEEAGTPQECLAAVKFLFSLGADVNTVNAKGETAMHGAAYKNAPQVVHFLHEHGADIEIWNTKNRLGLTPLYIAEGYRPGNFKPSFETIDAISEVMASAGVPYPKGPRPKHVNN